MEKLRRPKTASPASLQCFATDLAARTTFQQPLRRRPESRGSAADWRTPSRLGQRQFPTNTLARSVEIQTDPPVHDYGEYQDAYESVQMAPGELPEEPIIDEAQWQQLYQLPGYSGLPVMQPLKVMNPYGRAVDPGPAVPAPFPYRRSGRNGSNWSHVTQCSGYLGNHIVFIDGREKSNDHRRFPPHGYPAGFGPGAQGAPLPRPATGYHQPAGLHSVGARNGGGGGNRQLNSKALHRARAGNKYWFEDRQPPPLTPNTIQGRIMKSGVAY